MEATRNVIDDGFTKPGRIEPVPNLHQGMEFTYRPMLQEQFEALEDQIQKSPPGPAVVLMCQALAKQLVAWSEVDADGKPLPITPDRCRRLQPMLMVRLYRIINGRDPGDMPLEATADEQDEYLASLGQVPAERLVESGGN